MASYVATLVLLLTVPFVMSQKFPLRDSKFEEGKNRVYDGEERDSGDVQRNEDRQSNDTDVVNLSNEINGMMTVYARVNFNDLPPESLEPMPTLQRLFPELATLLPIKGTKGGSRTKRATPAPGGPTQNFMAQAICSQPSLMNSMPMASGPLLGRKRRGAPARQAYNPFSPTLLANAMSRGARRPVTPSTMGQLNTANYWGQMVPFLWQLQMMQNPAGFGGANAAVAPGAPANVGNGPQTAPGGTGNAGNPMLDLMLQMSCMRMLSPTVHPPEPGAAPAAGGGMMGMMSMMGMPGMGMFGR